VRDRQQIDFTGTTLSLEELFYRVHVAAVRQKQDQVIVGLHGGVVVRDDDVLAAHHRPEVVPCGSVMSSMRRPTTLELFSSPCTITSIARRSATQRVHPHHVAAAHVREQRADGDGLRRDGDVDRALSMSSAYDGLLMSAITLWRRPLREHGGQDVRLLGVGERRENVRAVDVLLEQQLLVGRIAVQNRGAFKSSETRRARLLSRSMSLT